VVDHLLGVMTTCVCSMSNMVGRELTATGGMGMHDYIQATAMHLCTHANFTEPLPKPRPRRRPLDSIAAAACLA